MDSKHALLIQTVGGRNSTGGQSTFAQLPGPVEGRNCFRDALDFFKGCSPPPVRLAPVRVALYGRLCIFQRLAGPEGLEICQGAVAVELAAADSIRQ